mmetsp:Transcript_18154/g.25192  ORF Transcript_18154/g.25192 Transcript_18154/m.25192 type:complete len:428 (-) Transcript_18154:193-1476(-)
MKFGKTLKKYSRPGWRYINYKFLKQVIRLIHPQSDWAGNHFGKTLIEEINAVNEFFLAREEKLKELTSIFQNNGSDDQNEFEELCQQTKELREFMILNYIAVLKIVKKHDKFSAKPMRDLILKILLEQDFYKALKSSSLFTQTERFLKEYKNKVTEKQCTICIESCVTPVRLACGHEFCWECLARAVLNDINTCPLCRNEQSLNPVDLNISAILGAVDAHKYFPSNVDPSEIRKRNTREATRCAKNMSRKRSKCCHKKHTHGQEAVDLARWVLSGEDLKPSTCLRNNSENMTPSPFNLEGEIHFELEKTAALDTKAIVVSYCQEPPDFTLEDGNNANKTEDHTKAKEMNPTEIPPIPLKVCGEEQEIISKTTMHSKNSFGMGFGRREILAAEPPLLLKSLESNSKGGRSKESSFEDWINDVIVVPCR